MRDDPGVVALVTRASGGDQDAWHELVERYASLVYTICTRYRLSNHDIEDVGQSVWPLLPSAMETRRSMHGEAGQVRNGWDDERLLAALSEAMKARAAVPEWFIETGKNAFAWHNIDAELARLTYDSNEDRLPAVTRAETASIRSL